MAKKPKTRGSGPKAKTASKSQKEQSERFIETARELEVDESGKGFDKAFQKIIQASVIRKHE